MYVVKDGPLSISSQADVSGQGVTFFLTGHNAGFSINGGGSVSLKGPVDGSHAGILIIQDRNASSGGSNTLSGGSSTALTGAIYTPNQALTVSGNSFGQPNPFMPIVADTTQVHGVFRAAG